MTISTAQVFSILDSLADAQACRMYRVTLGSGRVSRIAACSLSDAYKRTLEIDSRSVILAIAELPKGATS